MNIDENEFFRQMTIRICGSLDVEKSLQRCLHYLEPYVPVAAMYFHLYEPEFGVLRAIASVTKREEEKKYAMMPIPEESRGEFETAFSEMKDVIIVNRPEEDFIAWKVTELIQRPDTSYLCLPLKLEGKRPASLSLYADGKDQYTDEHARLISLLNEPFSIAMSNVLRYRELLDLKDLLADDNRYLHNELLHLSGDEIIGENLGLKGVMEMVRQVAALDSPVLLMGETGAGKEVIANAVHSLSTRSEGPFIKVNCGAIPENLIDSELFGHEKGAFTGAIAKKRGRFERAHRGTIFLDEIGELPHHAQVRLLRVIQNREIERVGGTTSIPVNIRIITATHRNLEDMIQSNDFREDLWYRLNVFPIMIPPLRQRKEDIPALVHYFMKRKAVELRFREVPKLDAGVIDRLTSYQWPGNVRELENAIERALILSQGMRRNELIAFDLFGLMPGETRPADISNAGHEFRKFDQAVSLHIQQALALTNGKIYGDNGAARLLGVNPNTLRSRMKKLGIPFGRNAATGPVPA